MRITLDIDDDVYEMARDLAATQNKPLGMVISALCCEALQTHGAKGAQRNGIPLLPTRPNANPVTAELVNRWRDESE